VAIGALLKTTQAKADLALGLQRQNDELRARLAGLRAGPVPESGERGGEAQPAPSIPRLWLIVAACALIAFGAWALIQKNRPTPTKSAAAKTPQTQTVPDPGPPPSPGASLTAPARVQAEGQAQPPQDPPSKSDAALLQEPSPIGPATGDPGFQSLPESFKTLVKQAEADFRARDFTGAEKLYRQVVEANPENHFVLANLGATLLELGKVDEAEFVIRKSLKGAPDDSFALTTLGVALTKRSRFEQAAEVLQRAIRLDPLNFAAHNYLGVVYCERGDYSNAQQELKRSIKLQPAYPDAHLNLAVLYATAKPPLKELARQYYAKAIELGATANPAVEELVR